jgi:hypothetical protein
MVKFRHIASAVVLLSVGIVGGSFVPHAQELLKPPPPQICLSYLQARFLTDDAALRHARDLQRRLVAVGANAEDAVGYFDEWCRITPFATVDAVYGSLIRLPALVPQSATRIAPVGHN